MPVIPKFRNLEAEGLGVQGCPQLHGRAWVTGDPISKNKTNENLQDTLPRGHEA